MSSLVENLGIRIAVVDQIQNEKAENLVLCISPIVPLALVKIYCSMLIGLNIRVSTHMQGFAADFRFEKRRHAVDVSILRDGCFWSMFVY